MARPPKYEEWLTDEGLSIIEGLARQGLTDEQIAKSMPLGITAFYDYKKRFSEFSKALKKGRSFANVKMENALYKSGIDGNVVAQIFWLKKRDPERWGDEKLETPELILPKLIMGNVWASCFNEVYEHILSENLPMLALKSYKVLYRILTQTPSFIVR